MRAWPFIVASGLLLGSAAHAHARLIYPTPRTQDDGLKTGPCGGIAPTNNPTVFTPGQQVYVQWQETIAHPGHYRIAFSPANDQGFDQNVLADNIPNPTGIQDGGINVTLPSTPCEGCTVQLIMVMTNTMPPSNYYSCADIALRPPDAGMTQDAGSPDAGLDAGALDAGTVDAGAEDAGVLEDGGQVVDAGAPEDAGGIVVDGGEPSSDAGAVVPDAGTMDDLGVDAGLDSPLGGVRGGCGCSQAGAVGAALFWMLAVALVPRARRKRSVPRG